MTLLIPALTDPHTEDGLMEVDCMEPFLDCKLRPNSGGGRMHSKLVLAEAKEYCVLYVGNAPAWWEDVNLAMAPKGPTAQLRSSLSMHPCII